MYCCRTWLETIHTANLGIEDFFCIIKNLWETKGIPTDRVQGLLSFVRDIASINGLVGHIYIIIILRMP